jgi:CBS domain-containing protein
MEGLPGERVAGMALAVPDSEKRRSDYEVRHDRRAMPGRGSSGRRPLRDDRLVGILTDRDVVVRVVAEGPRPG